MPKKSQPPAEEAEPGEPRQWPEGPVVVGVGASAGGLEAIVSLLKALPEEPGVALVVVQHLEPHHPSRLPDLLAKASPLPVEEAKDGAEILSNRAYVIPPNVDLLVKDGKLGVRVRKEGASRLAVIDKVFASMAEDLGPRAMGVILSGTGSDGTAGLRAIKEAGGITFAQDVASAGYAGMPESAARAGVVDFVRTPAKIAAEVVHLLEHPYVVRPKTIDEELDRDIPKIEKIQLLLRSASGIDFRDYKASTFKRRLLRRMALQDIQNLDPYLERLRQNPTELEALCKDALISVTGFFREPAAFQLLRDRAYPALKKRPKDQAIRVWVPGCSTGEEVYSIAISLLDYLGDEAGSRKIQFFGTDINEENVSAARYGVYQAEDLEEIPEHLRRRFFVSVDGGFQVSKRVRDLCVFSVHNVYRDPPFSQTDLISCRNLLIYLRPDPQKRALTSFHYSLRKHGFLLLGSSETTSQLSEHFKPLDTRVRLYERREKHVPLGYALFQPPGTTAPPTPQFPTRAEPVQKDLHTRVQEALLDKFVPAGVLVDRDGEVLEFYGNTGEFVEHTAGRATLNLFKLAKHGLELDLRSALMEAQRESREVERRIRWKRGDDHEIVDVHVLPVTADEPELYVVTLAAHKAPKLSAEEPDAQAKLDLLQDELDHTREQLEATVGQYETTTEELRTANEEGLSINEELQSTNEELQTTAEELQSANEELTTLNEELQNRNNELSRANGDLENLLTSVRFPIVFLGPDLRIRRFTPSAKTTLRLRSSDVGRPLGDLRLPISTENLEDEIHHVIDTVQPYEKQVRDDKGDWYQIRVQPYRTIDNRIDGAVLIAVDISDLHDTRQELIRRNHDLEQFAAFTSHELRAPLRNMKQYLGLLRRTLESDTPTAALDELTPIDESLSRMLGLINALLSLSQIDAARKPLSPLALRDAVQRGINQAGVDEKIVELPGTLPRVQGDKALIATVFASLVSNAVNHNEKPPKITISTSKKAGLVQVSVADDGAGLKHVDADRVFDMFTKGEDNSMGIGLAVCRRIIEGHGGKIWIEPTAKGVDVRFTLRPAEPVHADS